MSAVRFVAVASWLAASTLLATACGDLSVARVESAGGELRFEVFVETTRTAQERMRGLRGKTLEPDEGLLLAFPVAGEVCIVNADVGFDIDVLYADRDGRIVAVEAGVPAGDTVPRCHGDTDRVLELRAGVAAAVVPSDVLVVR